MRSLLFALFLALAVGIPSTAFALDQFPTETAAQKHCPHDVVVWLNTRTGIWHYKGAKYYANTLNGAFVCEKEAKKEGMRASKNGS